MNRRLGPEAARNWERRRREGFVEKYLAGAAVLDIGYRGEDPDSQPIIEHAIGVDRDYPGYDGSRLPFPTESQDAVFASHVLEHIEDWAASLADWYRVLKTSGFLIIAVPHRDLYERKSAPPSRFNPDHKRFYTPASLLAEIEQALPVAGYRLRSLRDIDEGFDGATSPEEHATGCYEIELVLEKIAPPDYAGILRPTAEAGRVTATFAQLVAEALAAAHDGRPARLAELEERLVQLPLPPFPVLKQAIEPILGRTTVADLAAVLRPVLAPVIVRHSFDEARYLSIYPDVADAVRRDPELTALLHFTWHGYFEGRSSGSPHPIFR